MLVQNFAEAYPKTGQFIYIFKKVGLMNQAPTQEPNSCNQFGFDESSPYRRTKPCNNVIL